MFSYLALEDRIPADHPLRAVRNLVEVVLAEMSADFDGLYSQHLPVLLTNRPIDKLGCLLYFLTNHLKCETLSS
jgi:hypothetical protein